jgi:hypothetical protein
MRRHADKIDKIHARIDAKLISIPNAKTVAAMVETDDATALKGYRSFREMRRQIRSQGTPRDHHER